jgi:Ner family transcriptional regulator
MKWLGAEKIVADALQMRPEQIWPSRYLEARDRAYALTRKVKVSRPKALPRAKAVK